MNDFHWQDEYSVGDAEIDAQHRCLLEIMARLADEIESGAQAPGQVADQVFKELADHVRMHFSYEEQRIADSAYPEDKLLEHRLAHDDIVFQLQALQEGVASGRLGLDEVLAFLYGDWVLQHICQVDQEYAAYL